MPDDDVTATPLRALPATIDTGVHVVRDPDASWLDGSEVTLLERILTGDYALDSLSDELYATATSWPERYHLAPSRANVIRALDLDPAARVLEIGAGCGAITRYLGETCATVDALEPTLARARVAAARTAELESVNVFCAEVSDLPGVPAYDVVVVVGVLEYVGGGARDPRPYREFLETLRRNLVPGGQIILAIENPLGVKYLAGAPEDHSNEVFHSVEGYPVDGPARTFNRRRLAELARESGFEDPRVLGAFPDYKLTRMVFGAELLEETPTLAVRAPRFPSPDWVTPRPELADEARLWGELVAAGTGIDFANSFVLVARNGSGSGADAWPETRLATYFSMARRRQFQVRKRVTRSPQGVTVTSELLDTGSADGLDVLPYSEPWVDGESVDSIVVDHPERLPQVVADWVDKLRERNQEAGASTPFDLLPHNLVYLDEGIRVIDDEWRSDSLTADDAIVRGALLLARDLSVLRGFQHWGATSRRDLATRIAGYAGITLDDDTLTAAIEREAELQALVGGGARGSDAFDRTRARTLLSVTADLDQERGGESPRRAWEEVEAERAKAVEARDLLFATGSQLDDARRELDDQREEVARLREEASRTLRERISRRVRRR